VAAGRTRKKKSKKERERERVGKGGREKGFHNGGGLTMESFGYCGIGAASF